MIGSPDVQPSWLKVRSGAGKVGGGEGVMDMTISNLPPPKGSSNRIAPHNLSPSAPNFRRLGTPIAVPAPC